MLIAASSIVRAISSALKYVSSAGWYSPLSRMTSAAGGTRDPAQLGEHDRQLVADARDAVDVALCFVDIEDALQLALRQFQLAAEAIRYPQFHARLGKDRGRPVML